MCFVAIILSICDIEMTVGIGKETYKIHMLRCALFPLSFSFQRLCKIYSLIIHSNEVGQVGFFFTLPISMEN